MIMLTGKATPMVEFGNIRATDEAFEYIGRIADAMASMFSIPRHEAVSRISLFWDGLTFLTEHEIVTLLHEDPDYWARTVYYRGKV